MSTGLRSARRRRLGIAVLAAIPLLLAACVQAPDSSPRPLTDAESERLAVARFRNFDAGTRSIGVQLPESSAGTITLTGWFDWANGSGYAAVNNEDGSLGLVWWSETTIATREQPVDEPVFPIPVDGWASGPLDPANSSFTNILSVIGALGSDRPENPVLLRQSDAAWLRSDTVGDIAVDVFAGPSGSTGDEGGEGAEPSEPGDPEAAPRYWLDESGLLHRIELRLGGSAAWTTVDFGDADGVTIPVEAPGSEAPAP
jgi:hypothetical protein